MCRRLVAAAGAVEKTRTSTEFPPQRPQRCASTNSATTARRETSHLGWGASLANPIYHSKMGERTRTDKVEWRIAYALVPYDEAVAGMERRVAAIRDGTAPELVWLLEHPPLYTARTSARPGGLLGTPRRPVRRS